MSELPKIMRSHFALTMTMLVAGLAWSARGQDQSTSQTTSQPSRDMASTKTQIGAVEYMNKDYRFRFALPKSWKGYTVVREEWNGSGANGKDPEKGPTLVLGNPRSSHDHPLQDIPIMIFTVAQWKKIENDELFVSAAPIGPGELGRNRKYVFALPARFTAAELNGKDEVLAILDRHPLRAF